MVDYSEDERKAMEMVNNYFRMVEQMPRVREKNSPSQDRKEMLDFLSAREKNSQLIYNLANWVGSYDKNRGDLRVFSERKRRLERELSELLGGAFD